MSASTTASLDELRPVEANEALLQAARRQRARAWRAVAIGQAALIVGTIVIWEAAVRLGWVSELFVGQPSRVAGFLYSMTEDGTLLRHSAVTLIETLIGFVLGFAAGALGLLVWWSRTLARILDPIMVTLNSLPKIALTPILLVWLGVGISMKVALSFSTVFLVTFLAAVASLGAIDRELVQLTVALGGSRWQIFRKVVVPSTWPWLISAMKMSIGFGLTGAVVGEFVGANEGIGYLVLYAAQLYEMSMVWAGVCALVVMALAMYLGVTLLERALLRWREP